MTDETSSLGAVEQCFNFPADAGIASTAGNPTEVDQGQVFQSSFSVIYSDASQSADGLLVEGSIGDGEGILEEVTLNGAGCTLTSSTRFSCPESSIQTNLALSVRGIAGASPEVNLAQGVALVSNSGDVKDILSGNDTVMTRIAVNQTTNADPDPVPEDDTQDPEGQPRDTDGGTNAPSSDDGGSSGGGGSLGWFWLLAGLGGAARLARRAS
jgi:MYXO-CTERM domain-containing protein